MVYVGGGFGVSGEIYLVKDLEVREYMRLVNYMNCDDFRFWKILWVNIEFWKLFYIVYENYVLLLFFNLYGKIFGWWRVKGNINIIDIIVKLMVKYFNLGWIFFEDLEYCELC